MSKIEWTNKTWNPIVGCSHAGSPACDNCYAARVASRGLCEAHKGLAVNGKWTGELRFVEKALDNPFHWKKPQRIFVGSMTDLFHPVVEDFWLDRIFVNMAFAPWHTYMILTKRPERMRGYIKSRLEAPVPLFRNIPPNIWIGVTAEGQQRADERIPILLQTPAAKRFVSVEPMIGPVDLEKWLPGDCHICNGEGSISALGGLPGGRSCECQFPPHTQLDWVICGGESGPGARPMHPNWAWSLRDQCQAAGVPYFFKHWGEWGTRWVKFGSGLPAWKMFDSYQTWVAKGYSWGSKGQHCLSVDGRHCKIGKDFMECAYPVAIMNRVGKKTAGRELDGRTWEEFPS